MDNPFYGDKRKQKPLDDSYRQPWKNAKYRESDLEKDKIDPTKENMQSLAEQLLGGDGAIDIIWGPEDSKLPSGRCGQGRTVDVSNIPPYEGEELLSFRRPMYALCLSCGCDICNRDKGVIK